MVILKKHFHREQAIQGRKKVWGRAGVNFAFGVKNVGW